MQREPMCVLLSSTPKVCVIIIDSGSYYEYVLQIVATKGLFVKKVVFSQFEGISGINHISVTNMSLKILKY